MDSSFPHGFREPLGTLKYITGDVGVPKGPKKRWIGRDPPNQRFYATIHVL